MAPLAAAGLVGKQPDPSDGRSWLVSITPDGASCSAVSAASAPNCWPADRPARPGQLDTLLAALPVMEQLLTEPEADSGAGRP